MTYICYQGNDHDCGFASLKMLLANKTKNKAYLYINKYSKKKDFTFYDLIRIAKTYGVQLSAYEIPIEDVSSIENGSLVLLKNNHLVYLIKVGKKCVKYADPASGRKSLPIKEFEKIWEGKVIECVDARNARVVKAKKIKMTPTWMDVIHYALIGLIFASLMFGFYLINESSSFILTMVLLLAFILLELVENWYIIKELKFFDKTFLSKFFAHRRNQNMDKYKEYCDFKSNHFIIGKLLASNLVLISAFSILLCLNDYRNVFAFLILLLIRLFDNVFFSKKDKDDIHQIENAEAVAFDCDTTMLHSLERANNLAEKVALRKSLKKMVYLFISLCLAIVMMMASDIVSTNFIIFHFGIYFLMSEAFDNIIRFFSEYKDRQIKRTRFLDDCDL